MIAIGDIVEVLDEAIRGQVEAIQNGYVVLRDTDGFLLQFMVSEVVKVNTQDRLYHMSAGKIREVIKEKESSEKKRSAVPKVKKGKEQPALEVDLHIEKLVKSSKGMRNHDILILQVETAKRQLDFAIHKRISKVIFIHGVGHGVLRAELEYLVRRYDGIRYYDADYKKYGLGALEIYIFQNHKR